jgi:uncharacterized protein
MNTLASVLQLNSDHQKIYQRLRISPAQIAQFCQKWKITELAIFGSILRDDFNEQSDIDFLVKFSPETKLLLEDIDNIEQELKAMTGRSIDFIFKKNLEKSANWIRKKNILETAEVIYE